MQNNTVQKYIDLYIANQDLICENLGTAVNAARSEALENFNVGGIPTRKSKKYKHIDMEKIFSADYEKHFVQPVVQNADEVYSCDVPDLDSYKIFVLNGFYISQGEALTTLDNGAIYGSFAEASKQFPEIFEQYYNKISDNAGESLVALNTAFAQDGVFIYIPQGVALSKPIQIINVASDDKPAMVQYRNLFVVSESAQTDILICDHTVSDTVFLTNSVSEIFVEANAALNVVRLQNESNRANHFSFSFARQSANSRFSDNTMTLNGGMVCNNIDTAFAGEGSENHTYGAFLVDGEQYVANYTNIKHNMPRCTSNELYKGILDDCATGIFKGLVYVSPHADKTEAYQANNNILLTDAAQVFTRPQLEIYADDVKCSHGATVGQLDENALFYMRQRGISLKEARTLQLFGFVYDVIRKINIEPLRNRVADLVAQRLRGELSPCLGCAYKCRKAIEN